MRSLKKDALHLMIYKNKMYIRTYAINLRQYTQIGVLEDGL